MPFIDYAPEQTLAAARNAYLERSGLGSGGYDDRWVVLRVGRVPVGAFPNSTQRVRSVRFHDLHHVLTGYDTSWLGEAEIGAWELASGCGDHWAAWILNSLAVLIGLFLNPMAVYRAARRGRVSKNLYDREWDEALLDRLVGELRSELGLG